MVELLDQDGFPALNANHELVIILKSIKDFIIRFFIQLRIILVNISKMDLPNLMLLGLLLIVFSLFTMLAVSWTMATVIFINKIFMFFVKVLE